MRSYLACVLLAAAACATQAFVVPATQPRGSSRSAGRGRVHMSAAAAASGVERRALLSVGSSLLGVAGLGAVLARPGPANAAAEEVPLVRDKMGGLLEPYTDIAKGLKLSRPSGWNQFEGTPETYVVKWSDIINRDELVVLNSTPVKASTTSVDALGDVQEVGAKLAKGRGMELVEAKARLTEGILFYEFEFKGEGVSELYTLCVNKNRLWALSGTSATKRWGKRRELLKNVLGSFLPKL